jgi:putative transposase
MMCSGQQDAEDEKELHGRIQTWSGEAGLGRAPSRRSQEDSHLTRLILMQLAKLQARRKRRRLPGDTASRPENHIAPKKWVADFTYIWTAEGWLYAAAVMDLYSRRIAGWSMSDTIQAKMVSAALLMALWRRGKPSALMHHSDQGSLPAFNESSQHFVCRPSLAVR